MWHRPCSQEHCSRLQQSSVHAVIYIYYYAIWKRIIQFHAFQPPKLSIPVGIKAAIYHVVPWAQIRRSQITSGSVHPFSAQFPVCPIDRQTDRQTDRHRDHATCDNHSNRPHLRNALVKEVGSLFKTRCSYRHCSLLLISVTSFCLLVRIALMLCLWPQRLQSGRACKPRVSVLNVKIRCRRFITSTAAEEAVKFWMLVVSWCSQMTGHFAGPVIVGSVRIVEHAESDPPLFDSRKTVLD